MEKTVEYVKARDRAIKYIMFKMRTRQEVINKLIELEYSETVVNNVISDLEELEYINDNEYAKKFIESNKKSKKNSKSMIKLKLKNKGIDSELIDKYLEISNFSDTDAIKKLLSKKNFSPELEYDERNKIIAYCVRKGFILSDILSVIKDIE